MNSDFLSAEEHTHFTDVIKIRARKLVEDFLMTQTEQATEALLKSLRAIDRVTYRHVSGLSCIFDPEERATAQTTFWIEENQHLVHTLHYPYQVGHYYT